MNPAAEIWAKVVELMGNEMTSTSINTWFDDIVPVCLEDTRFVIYSPTRFKRDIVASRYAPSIQRALHELFSADFDVVVLTEGGAGGLSGAEAVQLSAGHRGVHLRAIRGGPLQQVCPRRRPGGGGQPGAEL